MKIDAEEFIRYHLADTIMLSMAAFTLVVPNVFNVILCIMLSILILVCIYDIYMLYYQQAHKDDTYPYIYNRKTHLKWATGDIIVFVTFLLLLYLSHSTATICFVLLLFILAVSLEIIEKNMKHSSNYTKG